jgi:hypothetical protein
MGVYRCLSLLSSRHTLITRPLLSILEDVVSHLQDVKATILYFLCLSFFDTESCYEAHTCLELAPVSAFLELG